MLTLYQRLVLGCLLLIAVVTGVSMLVRDSFVELAALDARRQTADLALSSLAAVRASLAREELTAAQLNGSAESDRQFSAQARDADPARCGCDRRKRIRLHNSGRGVGGRARKDHRAVP